MCNPKPAISTLLLLLLLLLTRRLAWRLVQKLQGHVTHTKKDMFGRQRKKQEGQQRHQYEDANKYTSSFSVRRGSGRATVVTDLSKNFSFVGKYSQKNILRVCTARATFPLSK